MMIKRFSCFVPFVLVASLAWSSHAFGWQVYSVDPLTYRKLPPSCQSWFVGLGKAAKGMSFVGVEPPLQLAKAVGRNTSWMNHYCPSLVSLIRFEDRDHKRLTDIERTKRLREILSGINYQLTHSSWSKPYLWFKSEVLKNRGYVLRLMGESDKAATAFQSAIEAYPPYLSAYWELAALLEEQQSYTQAIETLQAAAKNTRSPEYLEIISSKIDELENMERPSGTPEAADSSTESDKPTSVGAPQAGIPVPDQRVP